MMFGNCELKFTVGAPKSVAKSRLTSNNEKRIVNVNPLLST